MSASRPAIREPVKRAVRQRCGFGCVVCGCPVYEYEHMEGYAIVRRHVASEITLLCDRHHRERTSGLLPLDDVRNADKNPFNKSAAVSPAYALHYSGSTCKMIIGGNEFMRDSMVDGLPFTAITIDRRPLLAFTVEGDRLCLTLQAFDNDDRRILWIDRNELRYSPKAWDIRFEGTTFSIRNGHGDFVAEIVFTPPGKVEITRGLFCYRGLVVIVKPHLLCYANKRQVFQRCAFANCDTAISVGTLVETGVRMIHLPEANRGGVDPHAVEKWLRQNN